MTQGLPPGYPPPPNYPPPGFAPAPQQAPQFPPGAAPGQFAPQPPPAPQYPQQAPAPAPGGQYAPPPWAAPAQSAPAPQAPQYPAPAAPQGYAPAPQGYAPQGFAPQQQAPAQAWRQPAMGAPMGGFDGVADAKVFTKTPPFPDAFDGIVSINELKAIQSRNPQSLGQTMLIVECTVIQSTTVAPGSCHAQVINLGKYGASDVKQIIGALFGADPGRQEQLDRLADPSAFEHCARQVGMDPNTVPVEARKGGAFSVAILTFVTGQMQPFRNRQLKLQTYSKPTRPKYPGGPAGVFTMHNWRPVPSAQ